MPSRRRRLRDDEQGRIFFLREQEGRAPTVLYIKKSKQSCNKRKKKKKAVWKGKKKKIKTNSTLWAIQRVVESENIKLSLTKWSWLVMSSPSTLYMKQKEEFRVKILFTVGNHWVCIVENPVSSRSPIQILQLMRRRISTKNGTPRFCFILISWNFARLVERS